MKLFPLVVLLLCATLSHAQIEKIMHQSFDLNEANTISFNLAGEYEILPWVGNVVLTETKVQLFDASKSIFNHYYSKAKRYDLKQTLEGANLNIESVDLKRNPIRTKTGECYEFVKVRIFIPEEYFKSGEHSWQLEGTTADAKEEIDMDESGSQR